MLSAANGKGRITVPEGRYVVSYESLRNKKENNWILAINIPLKGEELLKFDYSKEKVKLSGSFTKRLMGIQRDRKLKLAFGHFLQKLRFLLTETNDRVGHWALEKNVLTFNLSNNYQIKVEGQRDNGSHFERVNFLLSDIQNQKLVTSFELFTSNCSQ